MLAVLQAPEFPMTKNKLLTFFPEAIGNKYHFKDYLIIPQARFVFAIYINKNGEEFVAKMSSKTDLKMVSELRNEANAYRLLLKNAKRKDGVSIPKLVKVYEDNDIFLILVEKIVGKQLRELSMKTKTESLFKVDRFLNDLKIRESKDVKIGKLPSYRFVLFFPLLAAISIIKNKDLRKLVVANTIKSILQSIKILTTDNYGLVHRDLNAANVLYYNKNLYLLDMQLMSFGPRSHDFSNMFYRLWKSGERSYLENSYKKYVGNRKKIIGEHIFMMMYAVLYDLSIGNRKNKNDVRSFMEFVYSL